MGKNTFYIGLILLREVRTKYSGGETFPPGGNTDRFRVLILFNTGKLRSTVPELTKCMVCSIHISIGI
jgi:hypothetical protein